MGVGGEAQGKEGKKERGVGDRAHDGDAGTAVSAMGKWRCEKTSCQSLIGEGGWASDLSRWDQCRVRRLTLTRERKESEASGMKGDLAVGGKSSGGGASGSFEGEVYERGVL